MKTACYRGSTYLVRILILLLNVFITHCSIAQVVNTKVSPRLLNEIKNTKNTNRFLLEITIINEKIPAEIWKAAYQTQKIFESPNFSIYRLFATVEEINSVLSLLPGIIFIEKGDRIAKEEIQVSNLDLSVNKINLAHRNFPSINGDGIIVSVKENKPDTTDIDFKGRFLSTSLSATTVSSHASIMATMIAGGANSWHLGKGAAWGSTISSSSFAVLLPDANSAYQQYNISVQNHSYGVGIENYYGADAAAYDESTISNGSLLHVFSSGNSGTSASGTGLYSGLNGFANLTGSFKMAKNILTVGATDSFSTVAALSSKGPAYDGRVKPELVAFGEDGSSGAAALVSGTSLLLQHLYKQLFGVLPPNSLINDLDLELKEVSSGQTWQPWGLNSFPHVDSLLQLAKRKRDSLNNIEQITIDNPAAGNYQLKVTAFKVITASQNFHIAWELDSANKFEWQFPTANDFIFPSKNNTIRWQSSFANTSGTLEYSTGGNICQPLEISVDLNTGDYTWSVPAVTSIGLLRMSIGTNVFVSDTFTIANRTITGVGFNCPDSFLFYWNKLPGITNYTVYKLGSKYLEPITVTSDSFMLLAKTTNPSLHYAVAP